MKKAIMMCLALMLTASAIQAKDYGSYYKNMPVAMPAVAAPAIPGNTEHLRGIVRQQVPPAIADAAECFHLRGGIDYARLSLTHRIMMWMMYQHEKRIPRDQWTTDTRMFNETYGGAVDMVDFRTLTPIMAALDVAD